MAYPSPPSSPSAFPPPVGPPDVRLRRPAGPGRVDARTLAWTAHILVVAFFGGWSMSDGDSLWPAALVSIVGVALGVLLWAGMWARRRVSVRAVQARRGDPVGVWAYLPAAPGSPRRWWSRAGRRPVAVTADVQRLLITPLGRGSRTLPAWSLPWHGVLEARFADVLRDASAWTGMTVSMRDGVRQQIRIPLGGQRRAVEPLVDTARSRVADVRMGRPLGPLRLFRPVTVGVALSLLVLPSALTQWSVPIPSALAGLQRGPAVAGPHRIDIPRGYGTLWGPGGAPVLRGAPWGTPCPRIILVPSPLTDPHVVAQIQAVADEASAAGLSVVAADAQGHYSLMDGLRPDLPEQATVQVGIFPHREDPPTKFFGGKPYREEVGYDVLTRPDGYDVLTRVQLRLFLKGIDGDDRILRTAVRYAVAEAHGVAVDSTAPGTGIARHLEDSADGFSPTDIAVMMRVSGCAAATGTTGT